MPLSLEQVKMVDKFHCFECAGFAKARGEECSICDGEGNPKVKSISKKSSESKKKTKSKK